jgi:hypothetical protein
MGWKSIAYACLCAYAAACASAPEPTSSAAPSAHTFVRSIAPFAVSDENGRPYEQPFLGGFDVPRPQFVDIDADGDVDLFVQERSNELMFFENTGTAAAPRFVWRTDKYQDLDIAEWNRFVDLDHDGDLDLLAEQPFSYIRYYRNEGTRQQASFQLAADSLRDVEGKPIFADRQNIPNLTDLDCNRRLDLFLGRVEGTLTRYQQGTAATTFGFVTDHFEGIEIVAQIGSLHGANTMYWADYDGDGDQDLFWGDFFESGVLLISNIGSCTSPNLRVEPQPITVNGEKLVTSGYNVPVLVDIDADQDLDLFIGVLGGAYNPNRTASDNFYFLERADGRYHLRSTRFVSTIDVGSESVPALADLLVGNKLDPKHNERARLYYFRNTGSRSAPAFALADTLDAAVAFHYAPALADLDQDGDADLLLGTWNDGVQLYVNQGTRQVPRFVRDTAATIRFERGSNFTPALVDIDADGDLDVFVGEASGELNFVRNTGSAAAPAFTVESEAFQGVDAGRRSHPGFTDLDGDGDQDLLLGREQGGVVYYRNDGSAREPRFVKAEMPIALPPHASPVFADVNGDGRAELITGSLSGGLTYWQRR